MTGPMITGVFANIIHRPLKVVFRRRTGARWAQYDVLRPKDRISGVAAVIEVLSCEDASFPGKLLAVDEARYKKSPHRSRRYVHEDRCGLYCSARVDLTRHARPILGLWLATNLNQTVMESVIEEACDAAGIEYGRLSALQW